MVLPSASEGLANAWVEALACGTPLVITDVGGARELVRSEAAGTIVARDAGAIAAAVRELLAHPPIAHAVAANCRARSAGRPTPQRWPVLCGVVERHSVVLARHGRPRSSARRTAQDRFARARDDECRFAARWSCARPRFGGHEAVAELTPSQIRIGAAM